PTMKKQRLFGIHCVRCDYEIIAPHRTELLDDRVIRHLWQCPRCKARFESFPKFPVTFVRYGARNKGDMMSSIRSYRISLSGLPAVNVVTIRSLPNGPSIGMIGTSIMFGVVGNATAAL